MRLAFLLAAASAATLANAPLMAAEPAPFVDAHSHAAGDMTADAEIAAFRKAGLSGVVIMSPQPEVLRDYAARGKGFVATGIMIARTATEAGLRLDGDTAPTMAKLKDAGQVCQFGELPTRLELGKDPNDAASYLNPFRQKIYDAADARGVPVTTHVSLETPDIIAAVDQVATAHPHMKLILAHAGWVAGADVVGKLMAAHANIYADLSIRMMPAVHDGKPYPLSILTTEGELKPEWLALIERFPDRFMFGIDASNAASVNRAPEMVAIARKAYAALPPNVERAVASGNVMKLENGCGIVPKP